MSDLGQEGQTHTEGESPIPKQQHIPEMKDLGQGKDIWGTVTQLGHMIVT